MKREKKIVFILLISVVLSAIIAGCSFISPKEPSEKIAVTSIQVANSSINMAPTGPTSIKQIQPTVFPENATNKKVYYDVLTPGAAKHITVDSEGVVRAIGPVTEEAIVVRVKSVSNPSVYIDVFVSVVVVDLERIVFNTLALNVQLGTSPQVEFSIEPEYATVDRFYYEVINTHNEDEVYATVDGQTGVLYPQNIGTARLRVYTADALGETLVENFLEINVVYAPLDYHITVRSDDDKIYKQVVEPDGFDTFSIDIWKNEDYPCDPNPEVSWMVNDTRIADSSIQGSKNIIFDSRAIFGETTGEKVISVRLESGKNDVQVLTLPPIQVYEPLTRLNLVNRTLKDEYERNDTIIIEANHGTGQYPPDSYNWYLVEEGSEEEMVIPGMTSNTLYYEVDRVGSFEIACYPVVRGTKRTELKQTITLGKMQHSFTGNNISGVYVDGALFEGGYVAHIKWNPIPYDAGDYTVQIRTGSGESEQQYVLESNTPEHQKYFTDNGVYIPSNRADLSTSFSVKVKSNSYNFTDWISYEGGSISPMHYEFLHPLAEGDPVLANTNGYIVNMRELGELLNYVSVFRPESLSIGKNENDDFANGYGFKVYAPFRYEDVALNYPLGGGNSSETDPDRINAYKLISAAFTSYADSGSFKIDYSVGALDELDIKLWFNDIITEYHSSPEGSNEELPFVTHYAAEPRAEDVLPIDANPRTLTVSTSNQLYFAASLGYRPVPVAGSGAETIYNIARELLGRIVNDSMSDAEKVHAIYDYLTAEVLYDYELAALSPVTTSEINSYEGFYLEGVFIRGKAVCDGIAKAFNLLAYMEGIASKKVSGYAVQAGNSVGHAWNKVNIDGEWYIVDATWGSLLFKEMDKEVQTHTYLLVTDSMIEYSHHTYGVYPPTADEAHTVFMDTVLFGDSTAAIDSDEDIAKIANEYIPLLSAGGEEVWVELQASQGYRTMNSDTTILQKIVNTMGSTDCWSIGNGYFIIKISGSE